MNGRERKSGLSHYTLISPTRSVWTGRSFKGSRQYKEKGQLCFPVLYAIKRARKVLPPCKEEVIFLLKRKLAWENSMVGKFLNMGLMVAGIYRHMLSCEKKMDIAILFRLKTQQECKWAALFNRWPIFPNKILTHLIDARRSLPAVFWGFWKNVWKIDRTHSCEKQPSVQFKKRAFLTLFNHREKKNLNHWEISLRSFEISNKADSGAFICHSLVLSSTICYHIRC